ncbi:unnamed protein product [Symbiodinium natans]|uniref:Uncharacterized protein n=1 Tax=Symbiodinium natans TaxID=878477 RepID=A0A812L013_9DINO|nr:unnamed protein product [Symbiodinium natans]
MPAPNARPLLSAVLAELPPEWDVCFLAPTDLDRSPDDAGLVSLVSTMCYGTNAYLISAKGAERLLESTEDQDLLPVDELLPALALPQGHPRRDVARLLRDAPKLLLYRLRPGANLIIPALRSWDSDTEASAPVTAVVPVARAPCGICGGLQAADHRPGKACVVARGLSSDPQLAALRGGGFCMMAPLHPVLPGQVAAEVDQISSAVGAGGAEQATEWLAPIHEARLRHDVKLPLTATVVQLLNTVIQEHGWLFRVFLGDTARLVELGAVVACPGAPPQPWHADVDFDDGGGARILQAFVALQDVSENMGPTEVLVGSHTRDFHRSWQQAGQRSDHLARQSLTLDAGALAILDGHVVHRGAGNTSALPRRLLHFAFMSAGRPPPGFTYHLVDELVQTPVTLEHFPLDPESSSYSLPKKESTMRSERMRVQRSSLLSVLREPRRAVRLDADGDLDVETGSEQTSQQMPVELQIHLRHPGGTWLSPEAIVGRHPEKASLPDGLRLWACDVCLADVLLAKPGLACGRVVLDLACGCALPSVAAARVALHVFAVDGQEAVLRNAAVNLRRNGAGATALRCWGRGASPAYRWRREDWPRLKNVRLLLWSDPLREEGSAERLMQTLLGIRRWFRTPARFQLGRSQAPRLLMAVELRRYFSMTTLRDEVLELPHFKALCRRRGFSCKRLAAASLPTRLAIVRPRNVAVFSVRPLRSIRERRMPCRSR